METLNSMLYLLSYNSKVTTHALGVLSSYFNQHPINETKHINIRREGNITSRKIKVLKTKMKNLMGESLTHLDNEFEKFKRGILKV